MRALVTGAAGFIGSTLVDRLLADGHDVLGVDSFTPYYARQLKESNLAGALAHERFDFVEADLRVRDPAAFLSGVDVVFHQAAQPGRVRFSWSHDFVQYDEHNILVTQRLLEAAKDSSTLRRFVYASSSSVYGNAPRYPTTEDMLPQPHSPYGVTKLAGEHLCGLYAENYSVPTITLRYFTVYGPRQRPDMGTHRLITSAIESTDFPLYGTGEQVRDFTFVDDVVGATLAAAGAPVTDVPQGTVVNVGGGGSIRMNDLIRNVSELVGAEVRVVRYPGQPGDVDRAGGSIDRAKALLGWAPQTALDEGLRAQIAWLVAGRTSKR